MGEAAVTRVLLRAIRWLFAIVATSGAWPAAAQTARAPELEQTEQLVVMIRCTIDGDERIGAGIIVGAANDRLYIVTANHVVRLGAASATNIRVELRSRPGETVQATLTARFDADADVAVLVVPGLKALGVDSASFAFDRLGDPAALARGDGVFALGYPQGRPWTMNVSPFSVSAVSDSLITFQSAFVVEGHSGGALLDQRSEIVGLLLNVAPPEATARSFRQVLDLVRGWRFPVALSSRFATSALDVVSAGSDFSCSVTKDGAAFCWGSNDHGELGSGGRASSTSPVRVATSIRIASVSAGDGFACGLTVAGIVYCWGNADVDWILGPMADSVGPVLGSPTARREPAKVASDLTFTSLSAGATHACAVTRAGAAYCWGENEKGQLGDGTKTRSVKPVRVASTTRFRSVSAGLGHSCGVAIDGRAYCWGSGVFGKLGNGSETASLRPVEVRGGIRFAMVSAGNSYTCAVGASGVAYCWGSNEFGQLGDGTEGRTRGSMTPRQVTGGHVFRSVAASTAAREVTCGVTVAGAALCWGWLSEALGQRNLLADGMPGFVEGDLVFQSVSVGFNHACGMVKSGDVYCWGDNRSGQLGDGSTRTRITPGLVPIGR